MPGAGQFVHSNPPIISLISLYASLQLFEAYPGGMKALRARGEDLTGYLETCLHGLNTYVELSASPPASPGFTIITPPNPARGSQLSLLFYPRGSGVMAKVFGRLIELGVVGDEREPDVLRLAPTAMYNSFEDCRKAVELLDTAMNEIINEY